MSRVPGPVVPTTTAVRADRPRGAATPDDGAGFAAALDSRLRRDVQPRTDDAPSAHQHPRSATPRRAAPRTVDHETPQRDTDTAAHTAQVPADRRDGVPAGEPGATGVAGATGATGAGHEPGAGPQDTPVVAGAAEQSSMPASTVASTVASAVASGAAATSAPAPGSNASGAAPPAGVAAVARAAVTAAPAGVTTTAADAAAVVTPAVLAARTATSGTVAGGAADPVTAGVGPSSGTGDTPAGTGGTPVGQGDAAALPTSGAPGSGALAPGPDGATTHHRAAATHGAPAHAAPALDVSGPTPGAGEAAGTTGTAGTPPTGAVPEPAVSLPAAGTAATAQPDGAAGQGVTGTPGASPPTAAGAPQAATSEPTTAPVQPPVQAQVLAAVSPLLRGPDGSHRLTLQLAPEHLGRVRVEVTVSGGEVALHLVAADAGTRETLRHGLADLRAQLEQSGLRTTEVDVRLGSPDHGGSGGADLARSDREPSPRGGHGAAPGRANHGDPRTGAPVPRPATPDVLLDVRM